MKSHEYKTIRMEASFRSAADTDKMDKIINESAGKGWELVATTAFGNSIWSDGKTNGVLMTFRREVGS